MLRIDVKQVELLTLSIRAKIEQEYSNNNKNNTMNIKGDWRIPVGEK